MSEANTIPVPAEIGRANDHDVKIRWSDGAENIYPARFLRMACGCAVCVEEMTGRKTLREEDVAAGVHPLKIGLVGRYAMHVTWSDGHASGIYGFQYLKKLAEDLK